MPSGLMSQIPRRCDTVRQFQTHYCRQDLTYRIGVPFFFNAFFFLKRLKRAFYLQLKSIMVWPVVSVLQRKTLEVTLGCYLQFWRECLQCILIISIAYKLTTGLFFSIHLNNSKANLVYDLQWFFCPLIFVTQVKNYWLPEAYLQL